MKKFTFLLVALALVLVTLFPSGAAHAQASSQTWTSSITYYTPSGTAGSLDVYYYANGGSTNYHYGPITMNPHKAGSLYIGLTSVPDGFAGGAVLSANVPVIATYVQYVADSALNKKFGRILYSAFEPTQAATPFFIPAVLNAKFGSTSQIGVQNVGTSQISVDLKFYPKGVTTPIIATRTIDAQASLVFRPSDMGVPTNWEGSLVIEGTGPVVAASEETDDATRGAYAFEGSANGANQLYFPSMLCNTFGTQTSYYAIQNASLTMTATVSATYYDKDTGLQVGAYGPVNIAPGGKISTNPCAGTPAAPSGANGSAVFVSTGAPILGIGKVKSTDGMATAFVAQSQGFLHVAAPYVRWASDPTVEFRSYITIMNVGTSEATSVVATYYAGDGTTYTDNVIARIGHNLGQFIKATTNPSLAGAPGQFGLSPSGGAIEVVSDQPVVVVVRTQMTISPKIGTIAIFAEDYNAVQVTP